MKHKVKIQIPVEKKGLFGRKTVMETKTVEVDGKTYRKLKNSSGSEPYNEEEMMLYDEISDEWDN